jgi:hypothetical protein
MSQSNAEDMLKNLIGGQMPTGIGKFENPIVNKPKLVNEFIRKLVNELREGANLNDSKILETIMNLDKSVEEGSLTNANLKDILNKSE